MYSRGKLFIFSNGNFLVGVEKFFSFKTGIPGGLDQELFKFFIVADNSSI